MVAEKVEKTRVSRGSWLAATIRPEHDAAEFRRVAGPSRSCKLVFEAAAGAEADDRRQVERRPHSPCGPAGRRRRPGRSAPDAESAAPCARSNGFNRATMKAVLDCAPPSSRREADDREHVLDLPACSSGCPRPARTASLVRDDARRRRGNCTWTKKAPWSSSGRKPVGVFAATAVDAEADSAAIRTSDRMATRHQPPHDRGIAVAHLVDAAAVRIRSARAAARCGAGTARRAPATASAR